MSISRYEIGTDNSVRIWLHNLGKDDAPVLYQPFVPETKEPWASRAEAEAWAQGVCAEYESAPTPTPSE
jgi:hypothetical protein